MNRLDRQSFLGERSEEVLHALTIGLVGLGGGGSHVAQQFGHLGVGNLVVVDPDTIEASNLNRLIGGTVEDVHLRRLKVDIAGRTINGVNPNARIVKRGVDWQHALDHLKGCDIIVGGLDSVQAKDELDRFCRRFLIPYVDMGMDVHKVGADHLIAGQVVLSSPGCPCLRCLGIVSDRGLEEEARRYSAAGSRPQVVWPNGVLASIAVGLVAQLVTPWHGKPVNSAYLEYDGNRNTVRTSERLHALQGRPCPHYGSAETGDPRFDIRVPPERSTKMPSSNWSHVWNQLRRAWAWLRSWATRRAAD